MKDFKYIKHGQSEESGKSTSSTKYMQKFKGKKNINIPRIIYTIVLIYAALSIVYYLGNKIFFVNGKGIVVSSKHIIQLNENYSIQNYWIKPNDKIKIGDTLFSYLSENKIKELKETAKDKESRTNSYHNEKNDLIKTINLKKIRRNYLSRLSKNKNKQINILKKEVYLDVSKRANLEKSQIELADINEDIHFIKDEIDYYEKYFEIINLNYYDFERLSNNTLSNISEKKYFISTVSGNIISVADKNVIYSKSDKIIEINKDEGVVIIANVSQSSISHIKNNTVLKIIFSDGEKSKGIVIKVLEPIVNEEAINSKELEEMTKIQLKIVPMKGEENKWISRIGYTVKIKLSIIF